jgi:hypothetical protein
MNPIGHCRQSAQKLMANLALAGLVDRSAGEGLSGKAELQS